MIDWFSLLLHGRIRDMRKKVVSVLLFPLLLCGCFQKLDLEADKLFIKAIQDQRVMAVQDEQTDMQALVEAKDRGLRIISEKRIATGKSLEGLDGPDGKPLLDWETAEALNGAFSELESDFIKAITLLELTVAKKYEQRMAPVNVSEAYLTYVQTRRHAASYALDAFYEEMQSVGGTSPTDIKEMVFEAATLGLPTSIDQIWAWLDAKAKAKIAELSG